LSTIGTNYAVADGGKRGCGFQIVGRARRRCAVLFSPDADNYCSQRLLDATYSSIRTLPE
jgi:hypothetical protein